MHCRLPDDFVADLPARIIQARKRRLLESIPTAAQGAGSNRWWSRRVTHTDAEGNTWWHYAGPRYAANASAQGVQVVEDDANRTVRVIVTIPYTITETGEVYQCDTCNPPTEPDEGTA